MQRVAWIGLLAPCWAERNHLAETGRLILFDKRGTGFSDRVSPEWLVQRAQASVERGSRRLLNDLYAFGRPYDARPSGAERLQREVGEAMMHKLFSEDGDRPSAGSAGRRRRVA